MVFWFVCSFFGSSRYRRELFRRVGFDKCLLAPFLEEVKGYKHPIYLVL